MKMATQTSSELIHVSKLIENIPIAMLTTLDDEGALASRPMTLLEMDAQGALWFFTDVQSAKVDHLRAVNLSFMDRGQGAYVSLSGHGELNTDRARIYSLWTVLAKPWFPDGPDSSNLALLKFTPHKADYWDVPSSKMVRAFGLVASAIAGKPVAMGEHGSLNALSSSAQDPLRVQPT